MTSSVALGYLRVSSEQQAGDTFTSLTDQRTAIEALAARLGVRVVEWFSDPGFSGALLEQRPGLQQMLAYCRAHQRKANDPAYVLVLNDSRWGRFDDPDVAAWLRVQFRHLGWIVRYAEGDDMTDGGTRHIMRAIGSAEATRYRDNLRQNTLRGRMGTIRQGFWSTRAPFGYWRKVVFPAGQERRLAPGMLKGNGERIKLVPSPIEAEVTLVKQLFETYALGATSLKALCRYATQWCLEHGITSRRPWSVTALKGLLENHAYVGDLPGGRRTAARMAQGDWKRYAPEYVYPNTHEPLISRDLFARVQAQFAHIPPTGKATVDYRVGGLVTCVYCGAPYVGGGRGKSLADGTWVSVYIDRDGRDKKCGPKAGTISRHLLEPAIITQFAAHVRAHATDAHAAAVLGAMLRAQQDAPSPRAQLDREQRTIEDKIRRLVDAVEQGTLNGDEVKARLALHHAALHRVQQERVRLTHPETSTVKDRLAALVAVAQDIERVATHCTGPELRALLSPWTAHMTFDKRTRVLELCFYTLAGAVPTHPNALASHSAQPTHRKTELHSICPSPSPCSPRVDSCRPRRCRACVRSGNSDWMVSCAQCAACSRLPAT